MGYSPYPSLLVRCSSRLSMDHALLAHSICARQHRLTHGRFFLKSLLFVTRHVLVAVGARGKRKKRKEQLVRDPVTNVPEITFPFFATASLPDGESRGISPDGLSRVVASLGSQQFDGSTTRGLLLPRPLVYFN